MAKPKTTTRARPAKRPPNADDLGLAGIGARFVEAERLAVAGDWPGAAEQLVAAWHATRSPEIADVVAALDRRASPPPIERPTQRDREAEWLKLAAKGGDVVLPSLCATPWPPLVGTAEDRVVALVARAPSPRISHALVAIMANGQYTSGAGQKLSRIIVRGLLAHRDPAVTRYLDAQRPSPTLTKTFASLLAKPRPPVPALAAADAAALARIAALVAPAAAMVATHGDLLAAVYAAPHDDAPREVLADALATAGDPRGELIALQLAEHRGAGTEKTRARTRALLRAAGTRWDGGIHADGEIDRIDYARGFPSTVRIRMAPAFAAIGWSTVERLELAGLTPFALGATDRLIGLREIVGLAADQLQQLALPRPAQLEDIGIVGDPAPLEFASVAFAPARIGFTDTSDGALRLVARRLDRWPIGKRVIEMRVEGELSAASLGLAYRLLADGAQLQVVHLAGMGIDIGLALAQWTARCARDELRLEWINGHNDPSVPLDGFTPPPTVKRVVVAAPVDMAGIVREIRGRAKRWNAELVSEMRERT